MVDCKLIKTLEEGVDLAVTQFQVKKITKKKAYVKNLNIKSI